MLALSQTEEVGQMCSLAKGFALIESQKFDTDECVFSNFIIEINDWIPNQELAIK